MGADAPVPVWLYVAWLCVAAIWPVCTLVHWCETRFTTWPRLFRWPYLAVRWYLVVLVASGLFYAWTQNMLAPRWLSAVGERLFAAERVIEIAAVISALALAAADEHRRSRQSATTAR